MRRTLRRISRSKRGGDELDIESGIVEPITPMKAIPPDPERFNLYDKKIRSHLSKPLPSEAVTNIFGGPTPEQKQSNENKMMFNEDPLNQDPFEREQLNIFNETGGRKRRKSKKRIARHNKSKRRSKSKRRNRRH